MAQPAMPTWATEDDCEVHFDLLLVCPHIVKTSSDLYHSGTFCGVSCVELTLTNLSNKPLHRPQANVDIYNLSNNKVTDGLVWVDGLPPKITYQTNTAAMQLMGYKVVIAEVCHDYFACEYRHTYMNP